MATISTNSDQTKKDIYYKAVYVNITIAVSTDKKLLTKYMKNNRHLESYEYEVEKSSMISIEEKGRELALCYGIYLPRHDRDYLYDKVATKDWKDLKKEYMSLLSEISIQSTLPDRKSNFYTKEQLKILNKYLKERENTKDYSEKAHYIGAIVRLSHPIAFNDSIELYLDYLKRYINPYVESTAYTSKHKWYITKSIKKKKEKEEKKND